jgi:TolB protein
MSKLRLLPALVCAGVIAAVAAAVPAQATAPGPDGRIAFSSGRTGTQNIYTVKPDASDIKQLTFLTGGQSAYTEPSWSPDGKTIAFTEFGPDPSRLWLINADGSNQHPLFVEDPAYSDAQPSFSPDGSRVIFRRCTFTSKLETCAVYSIKTDGHGLNALTHNVGTSVGDAIDVKPEYSPDGTTVSFSSFNRGGIANGIYLMGAHGNGMHLITPTATEAVDADWAPDGSKLAFWAPCCVPGFSTIWTIRPDGTGMQQLTNSSAGFDIRPSFAPQGGRIVFERIPLDFGPSSLYIVNANGGPATLFMADASNPSWGPAS